jgi:hypothetical protein
MELIWELNPSSDGGSLTTLAAPQMTDVDPKRCGKSANPLKGTLALQAGRGQLWR